MGSGVIWHRVHGRSVGPDWYCMVPKQVWLLPRSHAIFNSSICIHAERKVHLNITFLIVGIVWLLALVDSGCMYCSRSSSSQTGVNDHVRSLLGYHWSFLHLWGKHWWIFYCIVVGVWLGNWGGVLIEGRWQYRWLQVEVVQDARFVWVAGDIHVPWVWV